MTWEDWLLRVLPTDAQGNVILREIPVTVDMRGHLVEATVEEAIEVATIVELFGDVLGSAPPDGPLPEATYQALLAKADAMGSPMWRQHWERFRSEGRL